MLKYGICLFQFIVKLWRADWGTDFIAGVFRKNSCILSQNFATRITILRRLFEIIDLDILFDLINTKSFVNKICTYYIDGFWQMRYQTKDIVGYFKLVQKLFNFRLFSRINLQSKILNLLQRSHEILVFA